VQEVNLSTRDAIYYGGLIGGMIVGVTLMRALGFGGIIQLLGGVVVGVGLGYVLEQVYKSSR